MHNKTEINKLEFPASVADIELSSDGKLLTAAYANKVAFWNVDTSVALLHNVSLINIGSLMPLTAECMCVADVRPVLLQHRQQCVSVGLGGLLHKIFRYLPKCKLKWVCSKTCNSNTAAPSVELGENNNVLYTCH